MRSCAVCFFFRREEGSDGGDCLVEPPVPVLVGSVPTATGFEAQFVSVLPSVQDQDYCGRFSHRNEKPVARAPAVG